MPYFYFYYSFTVIDSVQQRSGHITKKVADCSFLQSATSDKLSDNVYFYLKDCFCKFLLLLFDIDFLIGDNSCGFDIQRRPLQNILSY